MAVLSEVTNSIKTKPHRTECYLEVLIKTIDLLMRTDSVVNNTDYAISAVRFKERAIWPTTQKMAYQTGLMHGLLVLGGFLEISRYSSDWWINSSVCLLTLTSFIPFIRGVRQEMTYRFDKNKTIDTGLSQAMTNFSNALVEMTFDAEINRAGCH